MYVLHCEWGVRVSHWGRVGGSALLCDACSDGWEKDGGGSSQVVLLMETSLTETNGPQLLPHVIRQPAVACWCCQFLDIQQPKIRIGIS